MKSVTVFILCQLFLTAYAYSALGGVCDTCFPWQTCVDNKCILCSKPSSFCGDSTWPCCPGTTCEPIPGLQNASQCVPNHNSCRTDADCKGGLRCDITLGKCGICKSDGSVCLDFTRCCSGYCNLKKNICQNLFYNVTFVPLD